MSMDDRPNVSIWGTILSIIEIALNIYQVVAEKGQGLMVAEDEANKLLSEKAIAQGETADGFVQYQENSPGESAAAYELIKNGHITDPDVIEQYGTPEEIEADGRFLNPEYFGPLSEPDSIPGLWGPLKETAPIDNGVYFFAGEQGGGIAVHKTVADFSMSEFASGDEYEAQGDYRYYGLEKGAAIALFELSATHPKVLNLITSWESLMHTLAAEFPGYTANWNSSSAPDNIITDTPAPTFMFLQRHLDEAAAGPPIEQEQDEDNFFEAPDYFEQEP